MDKNSVGADGLDCATMCVPALALPSVRERKKPFESCFNLQYCKQKDIKLTLSLLTYLEVYRQQFVATYKHGPGLKVNLNMSAQLCVNCVLTSSDSCE